MEFIFVILLELCVGRKHQSPWTKLPLVHCLLRAKKVAHGKYVVQYVVSFDRARKGKKHESIGERLTGEVRFRTRGLTINKKKPCAHSDLIHAQILSPSPCPWSAAHNSTSNRAESSLVKQPSSAKNSWTGSSLYLGSFESAQTAAL